jgi:cell wall-associated NlpC family hydrolase
MKIYHLLLPFCAALAASTSFGQEAGTGTTDTQSTELGVVKKVTVGQVAEVLKGASVYTNPDLGSKAYFSVKPNDQLIVNVNAPKGWSKVWLTNGTYGYIQSGAVKVLAFNVSVATDQVGQVNRNAKVRSLPDENAKALFSVKASENLVVKADGPDGWARVALNNGAYGYIAQDAVTFLDYEVPKEDLIQRVSPTLTSRGSMARGGREGAAEKGLDYIGTPYVWGGNDIENGIDCSGFVQKLYGSFGMKLPRTAAEQARYGTPITRLEDLRKGDRLYFWETKRNKIGHTGIYLGDGKFVHSSMTHRGVAVDDLREGRWMKILFAARR